MTGSTDSKLRRVERLRVACYLLSLAFFAYLAGMAHRYYWDVPHWDGWEFVPFLEKAYDGTLTLGDFWEQLNETRLFFSKMVALLLARMTGWNLAYEVGLSIVLGFTIWSAIAFQLGRTERDLEQREVLWILPVAAMLVFSLNQWRNWMWGLQFCVFMGAVSMICSIVVLARPPFRWWRFALAASLSFVATFSTVHALGTWVGTGFVVFAIPTASVRRKAVYLFLWGVTAGLTALVFLYGFEKTPSNYSLLASMHNPIGYARYVLTFLGAPLANYNHVLACFLGLVGVLLWCCAVAGSRRYGSLSLRAMSPYVGMALVPVALAMVTAIKHYEGMLQQPLSSRYMTWSTFFWVGLACQAYWFLRTTEHDQRTPGAFRKAAWCTVAGIVCFGLLACAFGSYCADERHDGIQPGRHALITGTNEADYRLLYPRPEFVKQKRQFLLENRLTVFRNLPPSKPTR